MEDIAVKEPRIIALLTDFGIRDHFVGEMKGAILSISPDSQIVDITHQVDPQDIASAGFLLWACYKTFPKGTVFVAVVDPGVGSDRRRIALATKDHTFIAPDNGLLTYVIRSSSGRLFEITNQAVFSRNLSGTFDGRDVFGPAGAHIAAGSEAAALGEEIFDPIMLPGSFPEVIGDEAEIVHIDHFGNLITGFCEEDISGSLGLLVAEKKVSERRRYFSDDGEDELFLIPGSAGLIEIAADRDSAARILKASVGDRVKIIRGNDRLSQ